MRVVFISVQQFFAEREKAWFRDAVVFQYDAPVCLVEHPIQSVRNTLPTSCVRRGIPLCDSAWPIDAVYDGARPPAELRFAAVSRAVCYDEKSSGPDDSQRFHQSLCALWAIENEYGDRSLKHGFCVYQ
jgi:hypothetical protein